MFDNLKNMGKMVQQATQMKKRMQEVQAELKKHKVSGYGAGGKVEIVVNGEIDVLEVKINPEMYADKDPRKLEIAIKEAFNLASSKAKNLATENLKKVTGGMNIPGLT